MMPSPFPEMNPYIERSFVLHDFHEHFIPYIAGTLNRQLVPHYFARIDEHVYLHEMSADERRLVGRADVTVTPTSSAAHAPSRGSPLDAPAQVTLLEPAIDEERISFLEIRDRENRNLVTVIELLSPSNKEKGPDRSQYLTKRSEFLRSGVNLVEIDLLRGGSRMPMSGLPACDYCVLVSRANERPNASAWPIRLADRLPVISVPLHPGKSDASLDLQQALNEVYDSAAYQCYIYDSPPEPALDGAQTEWASQHVPRPA